MKKQIKLLAPANAFPAEGADVEAAFGEADEIGSSDLLEAYALLFSESPLAFRISATGQVTVSDPVADGGFVTLSVGGSVGEEAVFSLDEDGGEMAVDLSRAASEVTEATDADGALLELVGRLASAFQGGDLAEGGAPIPLLRWRGEGDGEGGVAQLLGVWLAGVEELEAFGDGGNGARLIFEDGDVEGHGVREVLATLAVLGVMLGGAAKSEAFLGFKSKAERAAESQQNSSGQARAVIVHDVVAKARAGNAQVIVDVSKQRAYLIAADGEILINTPVSTARAGKHTPRGEFTITQRVRSGKTSTIYGCSLPCWMRLGETPIGLHVGELPGYPASAGCVRLPAEVAPILFEATRSGTTVKIVDSWQESDGLVAAR